MAGSKQVYTFGSWVIEPHLNRARQGKAHRQLPPKAMDLLVFLLDRAGDVVSTRELLEHAWPNRYVSENGVQQRIMMIRKCLGDDARAPTYIESVAKRGYRTLAAVRQHGDSFGSNPGHGAIASPWPTGSAGFPTLAILPLSNLSSESGDDYFSDGLTEDIITDLSLIPGVRVVSRHAIFAYRNRRIDPNTAREELKASHVMEGSVQRTEDQVRVAVQLSGTSDGHTVWAKRYTRKWEDQFTLQENLAREIVLALDVELVSGERARHQRTRIHDPEAGEAFYRGLAYFNRFTPTDNARATRFFLEFNRLQPGSILGYVQLAQCCQQEVLMGWSKDPAASIDNMGQLVGRALQIDENDQAVLSFAGMHQLLLGNHERSIEFAERAVASAPEMDGPYYTLGWYQMFNHEPIEAIENLKYSINLIPVVTAPRLSVLGTCYRNSGQIEAALATLEESVRRDESFTFARAVLASTYGAMGDMHLARREVQRILAQDSSYSVSRYIEPNLYRDKASKSVWAQALWDAGMPA